MALFIHRCKAAQDGHCFVYGGLVKLNRLEAACEGRVLLEILLVFAPGGSRDGAQLASGQCRLEQVGGIATASLAASADQGVGFVDEQDDRLWRGFDLVDNALQPPFEFAFHARACLQQTKVQAQ